MGWFALTVFTCSISIWLLGYYTQGDQVHYRAFYDALDGAPLGEAFALQRKHLGSAEPLFALIMWTGAKLGIAKIFYTSLLNVGLVAALICMLRRWEAGLPIIGLCVTNFYLIVLMTGAERLKIAYMILFWSAAIGPGQMRWLLLAAAPLAHFQTMLAYGAIFLGKIVTARHLISTPARHSTWVAIALIVILVFAIFFTYIGDIWTITVQKIYHYIDHQEFNPVELAQGVVLLLIGAVVARRKMLMIASLSALLLATAILGPGRVNMITFSVFFYILMTDKRLGSSLVFIPLSYLSFKTIGFILNILEYGNGFPVK